MLAGFKIHHKQHVFKHVSQNPESGCKVPGKFLNVGHVVVWPLNNSFETGDKQIRIQKAVYNSKWVPWYWDADVQTYY